MGVEREPWPGPPGCECDLSLPASERCTKGGWIRCNGALVAQSAQYEKRRAQRQGRGITPQQAREAMGIQGPAGLTEPWREDEIENAQASAEPAVPDEPSIRLFIVESTTRPGMLSVRVNLGDTTATPFYRAITAAFTLGDVLEVRRVGRKDGQHREPADAVPGESPPAGERVNRGRGRRSQVQQGPAQPERTLCRLSPSPTSSATSTTSQTAWLAAFISRIAGTRGSS